MNRRDFLSFKAVREPEPTFDLECHALYMRYLDAARAKPPSEATADFDFDPMAGEPPASVSTATVEDLLHELEQRLASVRRLRVLDGEWLQTTGLGERVTALLQEFRARGGSVVYDSTAAY